MKIFYSCLMSLLVLSACSNGRNAEKLDYQPQFQVDTAQEKSIVFGLPGFFYAETAQPFVKYINAELKGSNVKIKACLTFEGYLNDLKNNRFDLTIINGIVAVGGHGNGYSIVGKIKEDEAYTGLVFARKDALIKKVSDLKGKKISATKSPLSVGNMMSLYYLHENGLNVNKDIERVDVSSFESAIMNTYLGKSDAGLSLTRNWNVYIKFHPEILSKVEAKWETPPLTNNALLFKSNMDTMLARKLLNILQNIHHTAEGRRTLQNLGIAGFEQADRFTYKPLMEFKKKYDSVIY